MRSHAAPSDFSSRMRTCPRWSGSCVPRPRCVATAASSSSARLPGRVTWTTIAVSGTRADRSRQPSTRVARATGSAAPARNLTRSPRRRRQHQARTGQHRPPRQGRLPRGAFALRTEAGAQEVTRIGAMPSMASCVETQEGATNPELRRRAPRGGFASYFASNRRRLIRSFARGAVDQQRPWRCARARPAAAAHGAPGTSCDGRTPRAGQRAQRPPTAPPARAPWPPSNSAPRRPTSRGARPASARLGGHLADGGRAVAKLLSDSLELLAAPLDRALTLIPGRHRLRQP